jgi:hypothetical protein
MVVVLHVSPVPVNQRAQLGNIYGVDGLGGNWGLGGPDKSWQLAVG